jgi:hypothetical protein
MAVDINTLWELRDENRWLDALNRNWVNPTVSKNRHTEQFMDKVELEYIQRFDTQEWYDFLNTYFRWKFMGNHLHERLMDRDKTGFEHLFSAKHSLAAIDELDRADSRKCLNLVKAPRMRELDYPCASGLLALIFKEWLGTLTGAFLSLCPRPTPSPEKQRIGEIHVWVRTKKLERE